jgi:uncharacterized integral membrane protein
MNKPAKSNHLRLVTVGTALVLLMATVSVAIQNGQSASLNVLTGSFTCPLALILLANMGLGSLIAVCVVKALDRSSVNEEHKLDWQAQDAKLMVSIASDKEKQLEAKIATLEVALKKALNRS